MRCVALFLLRVTLAPALVLLVSLAQKRWGHTLGGRLVGLPLTTGPLLVLITLMSGTEATAIAAHGVVGGGETATVRPPPWCACTRPLRNCMADSFFFFLSFAFFFGSFCLVLFWGVWRRYQVRHDSA